ncbi:MAG: glutathione synthase [Candidatus Eremiobacteraeota bacterium]|nr:glutathione synthase [Candidatus Eremiobacteraeota bacterium]
MRIAFLVNALADERDVYTTTQLAHAAARRGHDVWYVDVDALAVTPGGELTATAQRATDWAGDAAAFLGAVVRSAPELLALDALDVLMLRNEPSFDAVDRPWAQPAGYLFGELARQRGVVVLSDPRGLALAGPDKLYTLRFPERWRPRTLITRDLDAVHAFAAELGGDVVLKPLHGGAGESVFAVRRNDPNFVQIFEAVARRGYVIAQEYLPAIERGSVRLFMLDGKPLAVDGAVAATRHLPRGADIRSNYRVAATIAPPDLDDDAFAIAAAVGPALAADGMFLVGLDIVGDKILEANLFSPGGLRGAQLLAGVDFAGAVVDAMAAKRAAAPV